MRLAAAVHSKLYQNVATMWLLAAQQRYYGSISMFKLFKQHSCDACLFLSDNSENK